MIEKINDNPLLVTISGTIIVTILLGICNSIFKLVDTNLLIVNILAFGKSIMAYSLKYYLIILIVLLTISNAITLYLLFIERHKNKIQLITDNEYDEQNNKIDEQWLLKLIREEPIRYAFLRWFPINGQLTYDIHNCLRDEDRVKIEGSKTIKDLVENNILYINESRYSFYVTINEDAYVIIDNYLEEQIRNNNDDNLINQIKNTSFENLFLIHYTSSDYN